MAPSGSGTSKRWSVTHVNSSTLEGISTLHRFEMGTHQGACTIETRRDGPRGNVGGARDLLIGQISERVQQQRVAGSRGQSSQHRTQMRAEILGVQPLDDLIQLVTGDLTAEP